MGVIEGIKMGHVQRGFRISGRVQGVFFRAWTVETGSEVGVSGIVRNRRDGTVEAHVKGAEDAVDDFAQRLWGGPPAALVKGVEEVESSVALPDVGIEILPTM